MKKNKTRNKKTKKKSINKMHIIIFLAVLILLFDFLVFKLTETGTFTVYNYETNEKINSYHHFIFAKNLMNKQESDSICILNENDKIVGLKYGIADLKTKDETENTTYVTENNEEGYLNGNYGVDAIYLQTSNSGKKVEIMISGVKAWVSIDDVILHTIDENVYVSYYTKVDQSIVHSLCYDVNEGGEYAIYIGFAPDFMQDGITYYSYDGNYFYTDLKTMNKDMKEGTYSHAENKDAYYNFYQYVPHRSYANTSSEIMNNYLYNTRGITDVASYYPCDANQSVLFNLGDHFISTQNTYGINATMMFALAVNESGFGQSEYAIQNHNIFGHAVYDENPDHANSYTNLDDCLYQHAYYFLQNGYCNPEDERYHGSWFGNKASGINVDYASDPYWGEKNASFYYQLDSMNGYADYNSIQLKTFVAENEITAYGTSKGKNKLYTYSQGDIVSLIIKDDQDSDWYAVASEVPLENKKVNLEATYTQDCVGYISKEDVD